MNQSWGERHFRGSEKGLKFGGKSMYKVAICDDEATSLQINKVLTEEILTNEGISHEITVFDDMETMIKALSDTKAQYDVLLSDILAVGMNGIEAAEELRRLGDRIPIIFISSTAEYALDGYRVNALRYLQKPVQIPKLKEALLEAYQTRNQSKDCLKFQVSDRFYKIDFDDIEYLESQGRDTIVVTMDESICVHMKFSDMEEMLPKNMFFRCHRSYIINLSKAKNLERYQFLTFRDAIIPVSQLQYAETKKRFIEFKP